MKDWYAKVNEPRTCKLSQFGECQNVFTPAKQWGEFCCTEHKKRWHYLNNRDGQAYREAVEDAEARLNGNGHADAPAQAKEVDLVALGFLSPSPPTPVIVKRRRVTL